MRNIPYDSLTVAAVVAELRTRITGGYVQRITQPGPLEVILGIYAAGEQHHLLVCCEAELARAHLILDAQRGPAMPPAFCMLLRKWLEGARVTDVVQMGFDRVFALQLATQETRVRLVVEISGRHSNLVLVGDDSRVIDSLKRISSKVNRYRETLPGRPYQPPPLAADKADPRTLPMDEAIALLGGLPAEKEAAAAQLLANLRGLSPFLAEQLVLRAALQGPEEAWNQVLGAAHRGTWEPVIVRDEHGGIRGAYPVRVVSAPAAHLHAQPSISRALEAAYKELMGRAAEDLAAHALRADVKRARNALSRQRDELQRSLADAAGAEELRRLGELLLAHAHAIAPESSSATLRDYYSPDMPEVRISLDPALSVAENAKVLFRRARRVSASAERAALQLPLVEANLAALAGALDALNEPITVEEVERLRAHLVEAGALRAARVVQAPGKSAPLPDFGGRKIRRAERDGWTILYGENAEANDYLTRRVAAPNDLWLHVRAGAGAHVVVRTQGRPEAVPSQVVEYAAAIAVRNSASRHASVTPVAVTLRKHVRRPRGAEPGTAIYQNEKTLMVERSQVEALGQ